MSGDKEAVRAPDRVRSALWIILGLVIVVVGFSTVYRAAWDDIERTDYTVYTAAAGAVLHGTDIYAAHNARGWNYVYPPPFALLVTPLTWLPQSLGALIWYVLEVLCIGATSLMSVAMLGRKIPDRHRNLLYALPLFSLCTLIVSGVMRCQASEFMIMFMVATFYWHFRGRPVLAGSSLAVAIVLKVFPVVLLLYFVARRQWRAVIAALGGVAVLMVLLPSLYWGWQTNIDNIEHFAEAVGRPAIMSDADRAKATPLYDQLLDAHKSRNQSLEALFLSANASPIVVRFGVGLIAAAMLVIMLSAAWVVTNRDSELALASAFMVWCLLIPPVSETHYFAALIMPLTVLLGLALYGDFNAQRQRLAIVVMGVVMMSVMVLIGWEKTELMRPLCLASLAMWGVLIVSVVRPSVKTALVATEQS